MIREARTNMEPSRTSAARRTSTTGRTATCGQCRAPVSTPLSWSEVTARLDPSRFTIQTLRARLRRKRTDPPLGVLSDRPDLPRVLAKLAERA